MFHLEEVIVTAQPVYRPLSRPEDRIAGYEARQYHDGTATGSRLCTYAVPGRREVRGEWCGGEAAKIVHSPDALSATGRPKCIDRTSWH